MKKTAFAVLIIAFVMSLLAPHPSEARGGGWWWAPLAIVGGAAVLSTYYHPPYYSYYYYPPYYPSYYYGPPVVVAPPGYALQRVPAQSTPPAATERHFIYPRQGQNEKQQADDQYQCHRWTVSQIGFDPTNSASYATDAQSSNRSNDYWRAMSACLDAHGYTVK